MRGWNEEDDWLENDDRAPQRAALPNLYDVIVPGTPELAGAVSVSLSPENHPTLYAIPSLATGPEIQYAPPANPTLTEQVTFISGVNPDGTLALYSFAAWNSNTNPADYSGGYTLATKWYADSSASTAGTPGGTVNYYFDTASNWNSTERQVFMSGLALWSAEANITFSQTTNAAAAQITFKRGTDRRAYTDPDEVTPAPSDVGLTGGYKLIQLDEAVISIDTNVSGFGPLTNSLSHLGGYPWMTVVHEVGHALGLGHAGPYNGTNAASQQYSAYDTRLWSLMSYFNNVNGSSNSYNALYPTSWGSKYPVTPMIADILAIQQIYGAPTSTPLYGGQVYGFNSNISGDLQPFFDFTINTNPIITLWNAGTNNTLDASLFSQAATVNLNPGSFSSLAGLTNNIGIALNTRIDRVYAGTGNDNIAGNANDNDIFGGAGDDTLTGGAGNDYLDGGSGTDTSTWSNTRSTYQAILKPNGSVQVSDLRSGAPDGVDQVLNVEFFQFSDGTYSLNAVVTGNNRAPVVTTSDIAAQRNQILAASSLFTVSDADGDAMTRYQFWDENTDPSSGNFVVNGVAQAGRTLIDIAASQLSQVSFATGNKLGDSIQLRAFDGTSWSAVSGSWSPFNISVPANRAPIVTTSSISTRKSQTLAASSLFTVSDADGDAMTRYQFWDENTDPSSGNFVVNGVAQAGRTLIDIAASQLSQVSFVTGNGTGDTIQLRAFDGTAWSAVSGSWAPFNISVRDNRAPVVTTSNIAAQRNQILAASSLFTVSDADGDAITRYQFWDENTDPSSGNFVVNGVAQAGRTLIDIAASQLSQVSFVTGNGATDVIQMRAFDGTSWSAVSGSWSPFSIAT